MHVGVVTRVTTRFELAPIDLEVASTVCRLGETGLTQGRPRTPTERIDVQRLLEPRRRDFVATTARATFPE